PQAPVQPPGLTPLPPPPDIPLIPGGGTGEEDMGGAPPGLPAGGGEGEVPAGGTNPLTGEEVPFGVMPEDTETFQALIEPLRQQALGQLEDPGVFNDELFQESLDQGRRAVEADLARRGFAPESSGTIGAETFQQNVVQPLQRDRLNRLNQARQQAFQQATGLTQMAEQLARGQRGEQRTERGFIEQLRNQARNQALQEAQLQEQFRQNRESQFLQLIGQALGSAQPPIPGVARAGNMASGVASGFGQQAQAQSQGLGDLAGLALTAFGPFGPFGG
ncbi:MAG: hypothetical protein ACOC83_07150, partial [Gemmatimonadota bacterium]